MAQPSSAGAPRRLSFRAKINFILGLGLAILAAVGTLAYRSIGELVETSRHESTALAGLGRLEAFIGQIRRIESAQRKYLITGAAEDLAAYRAARREARFDSDGLPRFNLAPDQRRLLEKLERVLGERMQLFDAIVETRARQGLAAAIAQVREPRADELNRDMDDIAAQLRTRELHALRTRQADTSFIAGSSAFLISWGIVFALTLLVWAMVTIHRYQAQRQAAEEALRAGEARLRLITDAVPALIGYADRDSRLQFHNQPLERWLGRPRQEVQGNTLRTLLGDDTFGRIEPWIAQVLEGSPVQFEFSFSGADGRPADLSAQLVPRRDERNRVAGYYMLVTDITALKEVDRLKSEFVTTVSHELRTPLTSIRGSLGLLAGGVTGALPDKARELVKIAVANCERLVRLVNEILDSEKMLSGKMTFSLQVLDLGMLVGRSVGANEGYAATHGVTVRLHGAEGIKVQADEDRLTQVMTNLLSNACKFSPQGSEVDVSVARQGGVAQVSVSDRGPGVPPAFRGRLFERFAQSDSTDVRRAGGTGLGLSICRGIIERLGGRIDHADREGGGSRFYFELPIMEQQ